MPRMLPNRDQLRAEGREHLVEDMLCAMEEVWGCRFEDGVNSELEYLDHLQVGLAGKAAGTWGFAAPPDS